MAKIIIYIYFSLYFSFHLDLLHKKKCKKVSHGKSHKCVTVVLWTSSYILYGLPLHQKCKGITHRQPLITLSMSGKGKLKKEY